MTHFDNIFNDDYLIRAIRRFGWMGRLSMLTLPWCFLAGVWIDPRWFATAAVPLTVWCAAAYGMKRIIPVLDRRAEETP